ncbi:TPA: hypothetical protein I7730_01100 [Vibrio vulnificus]|uniref:Uncharacterized protein n=1 Tax=Vibrio vulnificus TaxID=672 RepID=A0A8H9MY72_VIBVL|nr:hypothetical protein [Vibrio vulnificus]HAS8538396.1 hypothetical protein [Vibrio vulnificus]
MYSPELIPLESAVIPLTQKSVEKASRRLSNILAIKLSKSREHLAKAFGYRTHTSIVAQLKSERIVYAKTSTFLTLLDESIQSKHKRPLTHDEASLIVDGLGASVDKIFDDVTFYKFMRYVLVETGGDAPFIDYVYYYENIDCPEKWDVNESLQEAVINGEASVELADMIRDTLKTLRKVMSGVKSCEPYFQKKSPAKINSLLKRYKQDCIDALSTSVYSTYWVPVAYCRDCIETGYPFAPFISSQENLDKSVKKAMGDSSKILFGNTFVRLSDVVNIPQDCKWLDETADDGYDNVVNYTSSFVDSIGCVNFEGCYDTVEPLFPSNSEYMAGSGLAFGLWDTSSEALMTDSMLTVYNYMNSLGEFDYTTDSISEYSDLLALPIVVKGARLSSKGLSDISSIIANKLSSRADKRGSIAVGELVSSDIQTHKFIDKFIASALTAFFDRWPEKAAFFYDIQNCDIRVISKDTFCAPSGRNNSEVDHYLLYPETIEGCAYISMSYPLTRIASKMKGKVLPKNTLVNNLYILGEGEDEVSAHFEQVLRSGAQEWYFQETGYVCRHHLFSASSDLSKLVSLDKCHNVYALAIDQSSFDDPILLVGFDDDGCQVLNATIYHHNPSYSNDYFAYQADLLKTIEENIRGHLVFYSSEVLRPAQFGMPMYNPLIDEATHIQKYFQLFDEESGGGGDVGPLPVFDIYAECSLSVTRKDIQELFGLDYGRSGTAIDSSMMRHYLVLGGERTKKTIDYISPEYYSWFETCLELMLSSPKRDTYGFSTNDERVSIVKPHNPLYEKFIQLQSQ